MEKLAVVLFNLGGPDSPAAIKPFLFNLFNDPAILTVPAPLRRLLAWVIASRRAPTAQAIYSHLGGRSPLLGLTGRQAKALQRELGDGAQTFIAMRYWNPLTEEAVAAVKQWNPERIVLLPLYPQFSTTTTGSSMKAWCQAAAKAGLRVPTVEICCYPTADGMVRAQADLLGQALDDIERAGKGTEVRVLFSAHGLPKKVIARGDPYQKQVEMSARAVAEALGKPDLDWLVSYQSRVGPLEWIGPSTEAEIRRAGRDGKTLVVLPIAFVSEHSETLVELDIEYAHIARDAGVPCYVRVPAIGDHPAFIGALADLVHRAVGGEGRPCPAGGTPCTGSCLAATSG